MTEIKKTGIEGIDIIRKLTFATWPEAYKDILSSAQLSYMLNLLYSKKALHNLIVNLQQQFIIAYENASPAGFAAYSPKQSADHSVYRLHKLYVLPGQQGKEIGKQLLVFIINEIKIKGASLLELNVNRNNKAIHFYKKMGFTFSGEEDIDIGEGYFMNDFVMELRVKSYEL